MSCSIIGKRQYSSDLPQGGLEVPCSLKFSSPDQLLLDKTKNVLSDVKVVASWAEKRCIEEENVGDSEAEDLEIIQSERPLNTTSPTITTSPIIMTTTRK